MGQTLDDGTVVPSWQGIRNGGAAIGTSFFNNTSLRQGEVKAIVFPADQGSLSRKFIEYTVEVQHRDGNGPGTSTMYYGCLAMSLFGCGGDRFVYTLRPDSKGDESGIGTGSKVLLACVNGETTKAWILGAVRADVGGEQSSIGHRLVFEFNGLHAAINKDGEFQIQFKGATDSSGHLKDGVDENNSGSLIQMLKNGDIQVGHDGEVLTIDHGNKRWVLTGDGDFKVALDGAWNAEVKEGLNFEAKKSIDLITDNTATIVAKNVKIGSSDAGEHLVLGDTYRGDESTMSQSVIQALTTINTSMGLTTAAMTAASKAMKVPVTGAVAASAFLDTVAIQLTIVTQQLAAILSAVQQFDGAKSNHLSGDHTTEK